MTWGLEPMRADIEEATDVVFELAGMELGVWDTETVGTTMRISLTPDEFNPMLLTGVEPEAYVRMAIKILEFAASPDAGDPDVDDVEGWRTKIGLAGETVKWALEQAGEN